MNSEWKTSLRPVSLVLALLLAVTIATTAQVKSTTDTAEGTPAKEVTVERGEVDAGNGGHVIQLPDQVRERAHDEAMSLASAVAGGRTRIADMVAGTTPPPVPSCCAERP